MTDSKTNLASALGDIFMQMCKDDWKKTIQEEIKIEETLEPYERQGQNPDLDKVVDVLEKLVASVDRLTAAVVSKPMGVAPAAPTVSPGIYPNIPGRPTYPYTIAIDPNNPPGSGVFSSCPHR